MNDPRRILAAIALALVVVLAHNRGNMDCSDSMWSILTTVGLIDRGDPSLDAYPSILAARRYAFIREYNGKHVTMFPIGVSVLVAPLVAVLRPIADRAVAANPHFKASLERELQGNGCFELPGEAVIAFHSHTERLIASLIVALAVVVVFRIALERLTIGRAAIVALVFAFGTSAWSTASRALWQHGPAMLMLAAALLLLIRAHDRGLRFAAAGALLVFGYVCRPTMAIAVAVLAAWTLWSHPRQIVSFGIGGLTVFVAFLFANHAWFGMWLPPYYAAERLTGSPYFRQALVGDLISPGRGLFVYSPVLVFSGYGAWRRWRANRFTSLDVAAAAIVVLHWIAIASFTHWWGGHSYGPRLFADVVPLFAYFLVPMFETGLGVHAPSRRALALFAIAAALSVAIHAQGALDRATMRWNSEPRNVDVDPGRLWDWTHPQFLAGFR
jgi:hypothetical protein